MEHISLAPLYGQLSLAEVWEMQSLCIKAYPPDGFYYGDDEPVGSGF